MSGLIFPKVRPGELTRAERKHAKDGAKKTAERECYRKVDERDQGQCRVYGVALDARKGMLWQPIHHHLVYRSQTSDPHRTENVVLISRKANDEIHVTGTLRLTGDADFRNEVGRLAGVKVERLVNEVWEVMGWV